MPFAASCGKGHRRIRRQRPTRTRPRPSTAHQPPRRHDRLRRCRRPRPGRRPARRLDDPVAGSRSREKSSSVLGGVPPAVTSERTTPVKQSENNAGWRWQGATHCSDHWLRYCADNCRSVTSNDMFVAVGQYLLPARYRAWPACSVTERDFRCVTDAMT